MRFSLRAERSVGGSVAAVVLTVMTLALAGCAAANGGIQTEPTGPLVPSAPGSVPRPDHVLVVMFENKSYEQVIGTPTAPYLTSLARAGTNLTNAHGETHPSQPNYIALLSGATQGVTDDSCPQDLGNAPTLASQLSGAGRSFAGFSEALPSTGFAGCSTPNGSYARKHNPWADFASSPARSNLPLSSLPNDYTALPTVSFVIPNMCNDMHDCPVATGDSWARTHLTSYVQWAAAHNSLLLVTFDEDDNTSANRIPTILVGPMVRRGDVATATNHYTLLRTLEDMYGLPALGAAARTPPLTGFWNP